MPTYPVINKSTGEKQELSMSMASYNKWRKDNPDWDTDWSVGNVGVTYGDTTQSDGLQYGMSKIQDHHTRAKHSRFTYLCK